MPRLLKFPCLLVLLAGLVSLLLTGAVLRADANGTTPEPEASGQNTLEYLELELATDVSMKLVRVPAGKFTMGSAPDESFRLPDDREDPQHEVTISRDFFIGTHEVTRAQFAAFVDSTGFLTQAEREGWAFGWNGSVWDKVDGDSWRKTGFFQSDENPVICISFDDALAFCHWLGEKTGRKVLLPTEAQWEYAARAGTTTAFPWGDEWEDGDGWANAADETAREQFRGWRTFSWTDGHLFPAPVGSYQANAFGLYDVIGNAWEWTADWYDEAYYQDSPSVDPQGPATGTQRVARGGAWMSSPPRCRTAGRLPCKLRGDYCDATVGFRIVIEPDSKTDSETDTSRKLPPYSLASRLDWPDWRGPRRDAVSQYVPTSLPETVEFLWTAKTTGPGHSGVAVADGRILFADKSADEKNDIWRCLDAETGDELWTLSYLAEGEMDYTNSPRANPVVYDGLAYLLGAFGHLHCVELATGNVVWKKHLIDEFDSKLPIWGMTATPLLVDDLLIVSPGAEDASLVALDRKSGEVVWKSPGTEAAYASPIIGNFNGQRQMIGYDIETLGGWDVSTGKRLWSITPKMPNDFNVPTPIPIGENLLVATENNSTRLYGFTGQGYRNSVRVAEKPKRSFDDLAPDMITPVVHRGMVICPHNSMLYCLDARTLELLWEQRDKAFYSYCSLIAGNGHVMILTINGELLLVRAEREQYELVARQRLFGNKKTQVWSHPALVKGRLYVRNENSINCLILQ